MTNIRCESGKEIDLLAVNPKTSERYHVESRVSTTFRLRERATKKKDGTTHKDGLDYFKTEKFEHRAVLSRIRELFGDLSYHKVLVVHDTQEPSLTFVPKASQKFGISVLLMKDIIHDLKHRVKVIGSRDDVMRLCELIAFEEREEWKKSIKTIERGLRESKDLDSDKRAELKKALTKLKEKQTKSGSS